MKMLIAIPSKARPYTMKTIKWLEQCKLPDGVDYKVFVEPQERIHYKAALGIKRIEVLPENDRGLGYSLKFIHNYCVQNSYDLVFHLDDDVNGFIDYRAKSAHKIEVFESILQKVPPDFLKEEKLGLVRFMSARGFYFYKNHKAKYILKNQGAWGCFITRPNPDYVSERFFNYSDTARQLFLWRDGFYTKTYGLAGINVDVYGNPGGCQARDRTKDAQDSLEEIKRYFPNVSLVPANNTRGYDIDISFYKPDEEKLF